MLAASQVGGPLKWVEERRENLLAAGKSRLEHGTATHGLRRRRPPRRRLPRLRAGRRRLPEPVAGEHLRRHRDALPRSVPRAEGRLPHQVRVHEHRRPHRLPRPVAVRDARPRGAARHRRAPHGHRPGGAAAAQHPAHRRAAVPQPERDDLRQHHPGRDARAGARDPRLRRVPEGAGRGARRPAATSASACRPTSSRRRPGYGSFGIGGGDDPRRAVGHGQRVPRRRLEREQPRDGRRAAHRRRPRRPHRGRRTRSRATPPSPASAPAPAAAAAGR